MTRSDRLALLLAVLAACDSGAAPPPPRPAAIVLARGFATADALVEIAGDDFHPRPVQQVDGGGSRLDATFRAWLGAAELADVTWIDTRTLRARVPTGLPLGTHDLAVEGPYGRGSLRAAYEVVAGQPTSLAAALSAPVEVALGEELQIAVRASNTGTWIVEGVLAEIAVGGAGAVEPIAAAAAQDLAVGATHEFALRYRAVRAGAVTLVATVAGTDPRTGGAVSATTSAQVAVTPALEAQVIAADPFGNDGTTFAFVAAYGGELYVGPNRTGTGIVRMQPDGSFAQSLALSFPKDTIGNQSSSSASPYTSIGFTDCDTISPSLCGPDKEDGRGFLESVTFAGSEWLVVGGARSGGDLDYVYMTRDTGSTLPFSYVDLSVVLGANTHGFSAVRAAGGRLYLGFPDSGGNKPYGIALLAAPTPPGLNALVGTHVLDLDLHAAYDAKYVNPPIEGADFAGITMVDAIAELGGRVYLFNDVGCLVSTSSSPSTKDDFLACSPALTPAYVQAQSIVPTRQFDLEPRERAWPATAIWNGRLYAIRNTFTGPQLWACDPAGGADPVVCDRTDWTLVAADASFRTRFGKPNAKEATLLVATPTHLYVGLDDLSGVHLFRTAVAKPALASDFSGKDGCVAGTAGCEGIGGDGFGQGAAMSRILDAKAIASGGRVDVVVAAGNGTSPVRIVRVAP
jgi:hypothetical protein